MSKIFTETGLKWLDATCERLFQINSVCVGNTEVHKILPVPSSTTTTSAFGKENALL